MGTRRDENDEATFARESGTRRTAPLARASSGAIARASSGAIARASSGATPPSPPFAEVPILPPETGDPTRDLAQELAEVREGRVLEPRPDDATRFFVLERDVLAAAESALATLTARRSLRSAPFGIYVYGAHDSRGLHVGGRRFDLGALAGPIAGLRATPASASFELRVGPYLLFGSTVAGATVLTVCARTGGSETARTIASTFALLFHGALASARPRAPPTRPRSYVAST